MERKGISLMSVVITIVVIIILSSIAFVASTGSTEQASLAKFVQEFSDMNTAIKEDFMNRNLEYSLNGEDIKDEQIYYMIANGEKELPALNEIHPTGLVSEIGTEILPEELIGTEYYLITDKNNINNFDYGKTFYSPDEKLYVTNKGEAFTLPGLSVQDEDTGETRWWINEKKYYVSKYQITK